METPTLVVNTRPFVAIELAAILAVGAGISVHTSGTNCEQHQIAHPHPEVSILACLAILGWCHQLMTLCHDMCCTKKGCRPILPRCSAESSTRAHHADLRIQAWQHSQQRHIVPVHSSLLEQHPLPLVGKGRSTPFLTQPASTRSQLCWNPAKVITCQGMGVCDDVAAFGL